jgi:hypothetical protein
MLSSSSSAELSDSSDPNDSSSSSCPSSADTATESALFEGLLFSRGPGGVCSVSAGPWLASCSSDRNVVKLGVDLDRKPRGTGFPLLLGGMSLD